MNERHFWIGFLLLVSVALAVPPDTVALVSGVSMSSVMTSTAPAALALAASKQEPAKPAVDMNVTADRGADWYKNPIFIGAGVIALVLLVAAASRNGRGTTVVAS